MLEIFIPTVKLFLEDSFSECSYLLPYFSAKKKKSRNCVSTYQLSFRCASKHCEMKSFGKILIQTSNVRTQTSAR